MISENLADDLIGIIGKKEHLFLLESLLNDENFQVIKVAEEAIEEIKTK